MIAKCKRILSNATHLSYLSVILSKICVRFFEFYRRSESVKSRQWCSAIAQDYERFAMKIDPKLWEESREFGRLFSAEAAAVLEGLDVHLGGGGNYPLIYFLARLIKPNVVLETGVAAGYSSRAILEAIAINNHGKLYSSDFPYFRIDNPEKYIGILVTEKIKSNWSLYIEGDGKNMRKILPIVKRIDLVHYDSDKTYTGRKRFMSKISNKLTDDSVIVMDDIQDNMFFYEYTRSKNINFRVFEFEGKYLGLIGL
jgi:predicted O-methyltransferase YrrM